MALETLNEQRQALSLAKLSIGTTVKGYLSAAKSVISGNKKSVVLSFTDKDSGEVTDYWSAGTVNYMIKDGSLPYGSYMEITKTGTRNVNGFNMSTFEVAADKEDVIELNPGAINIDKYLIAVGVKSAVSSIESAAESTKAKALGGDV